MPHRHQKCLDMQAAGLGGLAAALPARLPECPPACLALLPEAKPTTFNPDTHTHAHAHHLLLNTRPSPVPIDCSPSCLHACAPCLETCHTAALEVPKPHAALPYTPCCRCRPPLMTCPKAGSLRRLSSTSTCYSHLTRPSLSPTGCSIRRRTHSGCKAAAAPAAVEGGCGSG